MNKAITQNIATPIPKPTANLLGKSLLSLMIGVNSCSYTRLSETCEMLVPHLVQNLPLDLLPHAGQNIILNRDILVL